MEQPRFYRIDGRRARVFYHEECLLDMYSANITLTSLKKHFQDYIRFNRRNQNYHPSELILALMFAIIMGLRRINKTEILQYNGAFLEMLGLKRFPDQSTLRRFLKRMPPKINGIAA